METTSPLDSVQIRAPHSPPVAFFGAVGRSGGYKRSLEVVKVLWDRSQILAKEFVITSPSAAYIKFDVYRLK